MYTLIVILHVIVSVALILVILLQTGKGADIGAVFGGGSSQTLFGSSGPTSFLSKLTAGAAIVFMFTSLFLAYFAGRRPAPLRGCRARPRERPCLRRRRESNRPAGDPRPPSPGRSHHGRGRPV